MTAQSGTRRRPMLAALPRFSQQINRVLTWVVVGLFVVWVVGNFINAPKQFVSVFLLGITLGCIYALVALGYTLVYGIIELINFAHGDVFMWGSMVCVTVSASWFGLNGSQAWFVTAPLVLVTIIATVADRDLDRSSSSVDVVVHPSNVAPADLVVQSTTVLEGGSATLNVSFTDAATDTNWIF